MHDEYADVDSLEAMYKKLDNGPNREAIDRFVTALSMSGLVRELGQGVLELHPMLTGYLRGTFLGDLDNKECQASAHWPIY